VVVSLPSPSEALAKVRVNGGHDDDDGDEEEPRGGRKLLLQVGQGSPCLQFNLTTVSG